MPTTDDGPTADELVHLRGVFHETRRYVNSRRERGLAVRPERWATPGAARFHEKSANRKLSPVDLVDVGGARPRPIPRAPFVSSTYVSIQSTCPDSCAFKRSGCFADSGFTKIAGVKMDAAAARGGALSAIREEARLIDRAFGGGVRIPQDGARGGRDLRLHVGGDCASVEGARILGRAAARWRRRGGGAVWTFTHWWRTVPRMAWGTAVNVLASVETPADFAAARAQGYAPAIVVDRFPSRTAWREGGLKVIPCPAETAGTTCASCRLCLDRDLYHMGAAIAFAVHGPQAAQARDQLVQIRAR